MLLNALVIEHARTVTVIITWMYKWKWNWYVDNEVYVWRAREGYVTALSAASHACVDCPDRTDEESMNKLRTIAATSSVGPNEGSSVRGTDGSWTRWIEIWIINSLDRLCNGSVAAPAASIYACIDRLNLIITLRRKSENGDDVLDGISWWQATEEFGTKSLQSYQLGKIHAWVRHRLIVCSAMIATDCKRRSAAVSWSQHWTAANWCDWKRIGWPWCMRMMLITFFILPASYCINNILVINREQDWKAFTEQYSARYQG